MMWEGFCRRKTAVLQKKEEKGPETVPLERQGNRFGAVFCETVPLAELL